MSRLDVEELNNRYSEGRGYYTAKVRKLIERFEDQEFSRTTVFSAIQNLPEYEKLRENDNIRFIVTHVIRQGLKTGWLKYVRGEGKYATYVLAAAKRQEGEL